MEIRNFGKSDLKTSAIGFGGWPMARGHYGSIDENDVIRSIHAALDYGITLFDTAANYGWGEGETLLGKALKGRRDKVVLASKGGLRSENQDLAIADSSRGFLTSDLDNSLRRLQTDYLDLYLIHEPDPNLPISEPMETFIDFETKGKIRFGGVSNFSAAQTQHCLEIFPIICNQVGYHLFDLRPETETFPESSKQGIGIMAYGSLAHGLLTGTMTADTKFETNDWRRDTATRSWTGAPIFEGENFLKNLKKVDALKEFASLKGKTVAQLALAWVLSNPIISVALVGIRNPSEIQENVVAADWVLNESEKETIRSIVNE